MTVRRITLPFRAERAVLACGADLKGAFAFAKDEKAFLIYGFDDLSDPSNFARYEEAVKAYRKKLGIKPEIIVCDLHPNYFSTHFAENLHSFTPSRSRAHLSVPCHYQLCKVQHHEAHIASAIVDNDIKGTVIGIAFDGTGYGYDGNIWGGEFFTGDLKGFKRAAHLEYIPMPGGEKAIREPWRMAAGYLYRAFGKDFLKSGSRAYLNMPYRNMDSLKVLVKMIDGRINSPLTSSAGRLFDAVGSLVLSKGRVSKEAELPMELERITSGQACGKYKFDIRTDKDGLIIVTSGIVKEIVKDLSGKTAKAVISCKFHNTMADIILRTALKLSKKFKIGQVVLSGGVFQNKFLTGRAVELLKNAGFSVYIHSNISTNDSGIAVGQIAIANA